MNAPTHGRHAHRFATTIEVSRLMHDTHGAVKGMNACEDHPRTPSEIRLPGFEEEFELLALDLHWTRSQSSAMKPAGTCLVQGNVTKSYLYSCTCCHTQTHVVQHQLLPLFQASQYEALHAVSHRCSSCVAVQYKCGTATTDANFD